MASHFKNESGIGEQQDYFTVSNTLFMIFTITFDFHSSQESEQIADPQDHEDFESLETLASRLISRHRLCGHIINMSQSE